MGWNFSDGKEGEVQVGDESIRIRTVYLASVNDVLKCLFLPLRLMTTSAAV